MSIFESHQTLHLISDPPQISYSNAEGLFILAQVRLEQASILIGQGRKLTAIQLTFVHFFVGSRIISVC